MIIIWRGYGFLVALLPFVIAIVLQIFTRSFTGSNEFFKEVLFGNFVAIFLAGILLLILDKRFVHQGSGYSIVDPKSGQRIYAETKIHSMFFIPIKFWGYIMTVLGIWGLIKGVYNL